MNDTQETENLPPNDQQQTAASPTKKQIDGSTPQTFTKTNPKNDLQKSSIEDKEKESAEFEKYALAKIHDGDAEDTEKAELEKVTVDETHDGNGGKKGIKISAKKNTEGTRKARVSIPIEVIITN